MKKITIKFRTHYGEYQVPGDPADPRCQSVQSSYFTDDRADAIATAKEVHGKNIKIVFRRIDSTD
jgi:hypothetical protein